VQASDGPRNLPSEDAVLLSVVVVRDRNACDPTLCTVASELNMDVDELITYLPGTCRVCVLLLYPYSYYAFSFR
jgi:hypothetical protein